MILKCEKCSGKLFKSDSFGYIKKLNTKAEQISNRINVPYFQCTECNSRWHRIKRNGIGKEIKELIIKNENKNWQIDKTWNVAAEEVRSGKVQKETTIINVKTAHRRSRLQLVD